MEMKSKSWSPGGKGDSNHEPPRVARYILLDGSLSMWLEDAIPAVEDDILPQSEGLQCSIAAIRWGSTKARREIHG